MSKNINYLCKITRSSFHMKFTHNFKNVNWWALLPAQAGRIDSFLPGYSSRICMFEESIAGTAHPDPASSKLCTKTLLILALEMQLQLSKVLMIIIIKMI